MASLKEMRTRIASVKATRKITKAMQMVAAAKLRRAQEAATAARPYAERMDKVLGNLNARITNKAGASPLLVGTGKDQVHLLRRHDRRTRPVRRLQFEHRQVGARRRQRLRRGKARRSRSSASAKRARTTCAATTPRTSSTASTSAPSSNSASPTPKRSAPSCSPCSTQANSTSRRCTSPNSNR